MIRAFKRQLSRSVFLGGLRKVAVGTLIGQLISLLSFPIISRLYTPEDFGSFAVFTSVLASVIVVITLRYELAVPLASDNKSAAALMVICLLVAGSVATIVFVVTIPMTSIIAGWTNTPNITQILWLVPLSAFAAGVYQSFSYWTIRSKGYGYLAASKVSQNAWMTGAHILFGLVSKGPYGLAIGESLRWSGGSLTLGRKQWSSARASVSGVKWEDIKQNAKIFRRFPIVSAPSAFANTLGQQLPALLIAAFYGPYVAGIYFLVMKVIGIPISFVGRSVSQVYVGELSSHIRKEPRKARQLYSRVALGLFVMGVGPAAALLIIGDKLTIWSLGSEWTQAGAFMQIMAVMFLAKIIVNPVSQTLVLLRKHRTQLFWDVGRLSLVNGTLVGSALLSLDPEYALLAYSIVSTGCYIALYVLTVQKLKLIT